jgi:hypothetical protein
MAISTCRTDTRCKGFPPRNHMRDPRISRYHMPKDTTRAARPALGLSFRRCQLRLLEHRASTLHLHSNTTSANSIHQERTQHQIDDRLRSFTVAFAGYDQLAHHHGRSIHPSQVAHGSLLGSLRKLLLSSGRSLGCITSEETPQLAYYTPRRDPRVVVGHRDGRVWRLQDLQEEEGRARNGQASGAPEQRAQRQRRQPYDFCAVQGLDEQGDDLPDQVDDFRCAQEVVSELVWPGRSEV